MLRLIDQGHADTGKWLVDINLANWEPSRASIVDYNVGNKYGISESSNGKLIGIFETKQSEIAAQINYNNRQFITMHDFINKSKWLIDALELDSSVLTMIASQEVLGKDWNTPDEDEAWKNL